MPFLTLQPPPFVKLEIDTLVTSTPLFVAAMSTYDLSLDCADKAILCSNIALYVLEHIIQDSCSSNVLAKKSEIVSICFLNCHVDNSMHLCSVEMKSVVGGLYM